LQRYHSSVVILEYIDREFNKLEKIQKDCDQPAQEIGQNNQNQFPQRPMEYFNPEIQSPLTENSSPVAVVPVTLECSPQLLENGQQLEPLDKNEANPWTRNQKLYLQKKPYY
jgi:hypothetical protein